MQRRTLTIAFTLALLLVGIGTYLGRTAPPVIRPVEGLRQDTPRYYALTGARIVIRPGQVIEGGTLVIRNRNIVSVKAGHQVPGGTRVIDLAGKTIYPGLINSFSEVTLPAAANNVGANHWNATIRPQRSVAQHYKRDQELNEKLRKQGITAQLVAPANGILKGTSVLVSTDGKSDTEAIIQPSVAQHLR
ncbi:MAG: hypothetical protein VB862_17735, partial [Pirellulaceae bacterium]